MWGDILRPYQYVAVINAQLLRETCLERQIPVGNVRFQLCCAQLLSRDAHQATAVHLTRSAQANIMHRPKCAAIGRSFQISELSQVR